MPKPDANSCPFIDSFGDRCGARPQHGDALCPEHVGTQCSECGGQAVKNCGRDGPAGGPCGFPLCEKHECPRGHAKKWHS